MIKLKNELWGEGKKKTVAKESNYAIKRNDEGKENKENKMW